MGMGPLTSVLKRLQLDGVEERRIKNMPAPKSEMHRRAHGAPALDRCVSALTHLHCLL